ncbi:oxidoreductase NAD-binding domain protein [Rhexocercosporidium sp. MPI-PUGE-AT-0058]|nr:oxidoreductase NAD-binding domain protein [Rhexocercosporidium sp. MPI-PUGE-AT-0058]
MPTLHWDAIVIGSGIGGLTAASLLAKVAGMRVLVVEKHSERGGLTHVFRRDGASWDVGVHYLGGMDPGSSVRSLFDFMSDKALEWNRMPDDFERFIYPGLDFAVPSEPKRYQQRLIEYFPDEVPAIRQYFVDLKKAAQWHIMSRVVHSILPWPMNLLIRQWLRLGAKMATQTTGRYLRDHFRSTKLQAFLASQWGDYGLPPEESAFAQHAIVVWSYFKGGWFPDKGASRIARTFEVGIEAHGGAIRVCQEVTQILIEANRAVGVKVLDGRGAEPKEIEYRAPVIISNAGAEVTYNRLLPKDGTTGQLTAEIRKEISSVSGGLSAVVLYLRLEKPVSTLGIRGENYWISTNFEHDNIEEQTAAVMAGKPQYAYMSFPSAKSGDDRFHTAEVLAIVKAEPFSTWRKCTHGTRGHDYIELKQRMTNGLLELADSATPGLKDLVQYTELSTPLTVEDFVSHPGGAIYGLRGSPKRYSAKSLGRPSPISGLYLSGTDVSSLGVSGGMYGGVIAASRVLGPLGFMKIMRAARQSQSISQVPPKLEFRSSEKKRAVLLSKTALTPSIWQLTFDIFEAVKFTPGQFALLRVGPYEWRNYSIAKIEGTQLDLLISTRTGGDGSLFAQNIQPGGETEIELPFGSFRLQDNQNEPRRRVFIATGTGIAPFLPMFATLASSGGLHTSELLFGCSRKEDDVTALDVLQNLPHTIVCISRDPMSEGIFHGRVTKVLQDMKFNAANTDFYLCGAPAMVEDCRTMLSLKGAVHVITEPF